MKVFWLVLLIGLAGFGVRAEERRSGYDDAGPATRAMQDDDTVNPGFLWVQQGETLWTERVGRSCADCHGDATVSMRGVAARYPAYDGRAGRVLTLEQRIQQCRTERQGAAAWPAESNALLAIGAYVGLQSRGWPISVRTDGAAAASYENGRRVFLRRQGQLNLSCAQCHDQLAGHRLGGEIIPQGHPTGYPVYRLEWQSIGSLNRRLRNCMTGVRAEPFAPDDPDLADLELFLAARANGMTMDVPGVRP
jgi:L-cysteine S-thiosulfotransferase